MQFTRLRKWRLLQFSIRSMMGMSLFAAVLILWYRDHKKLTDQIAAAQGNNSANWSIDQILGKPNTLRYGDISTAWASFLADGQEEWVIVEFPSKVQAAQIHIYENDNPGAVTSIFNVAYDGAETLAWTGVDATKAGTSVGVFKVPLTPSLWTRRVKIVMDSASISGWNEIDAVALVDDKGKLQWASNAWASSSYGMNRKAPSWYWP